MNVALAFDGKEGPEMARRLHPDVVVLDVQMPEMDGIQVCRELKSTYGTVDTPIIIFTHHDEQTAVTAGLQAGAVDYIPKDAFPDVVLLETLRQMGLIKSHFEDPW